MRKAAPTPGSTPWQTSLGLRPGELVEVRSMEEILATLDGNATHDGMPFMPEMLKFCGQRYRVSKRAEKSCDTILTGQGRRVRDSVHLGDLRCDGSAHGGCQALCRICWREAWLKRVPETRATGDRDSVSALRCSEEGLRRATRADAGAGEPVYSCQVTRLLNFTEDLYWWDPRQYAREVWYGNVGWVQALAALMRAARNAVRRRIGLHALPHVRGRCEGRTPAGVPLGLKPGDWVIVRSKEEIEQTLNQERRNRGLFFDIEMLPYCGRRMRVLQKVDKIIDEKTGRMQRLPNDCWILEGAYCVGHLSRNRLFCTRAIYPYWREIWLRRADEGGAGIRAPSG